MAAPNQPYPGGSRLEFEKYCETLRQQSGIAPDSGLAAVRIVDGISIVVPDSLNLISPYVLREQEDWFEDETGFVRRIARPGMSMIDVGASYGVYTLLLATRLASQGHIWAFEPSSFTASCLAKSIACNRLSNVTVVTAALSNRSGTARLSLNENSEMNSLTSASDGQSEEVRTKTLDECRTEFGWSGIDFVKIDAEGEESNILRGGENFFRDESPLVMFEIRVVESWNMGLISEFAALGYNPYRLVPGLDLLVPYEAAEPLDAYQLNLFCCKPDRGRTLESAGFLITAQNKQLDVGKLNLPQWRERFSELPFARKLWSSHEAKILERPDTGNENYLRALELYFFSRSTERAMPERYSALRHAAILLEAAPGAGDRGRAQLSTQARILGELGERAREVKILGDIIAGLPKTPDDMVLDVPFLPVCRRFEQIGTWNFVIDWFVAAVMEQLESRSYYSSYYSGVSSLKRLELIRKLGFQSAEMERRRQLVCMRFLNQPGPVPSPLLAAGSEQDRNPEYWQGQAG